MHFVFDLLSNMTGVRTFGDVRSRKVVDRQHFGP